MFLRIWIMLANISIFTMAVTWTTVREECKKQASDSPQLSKQHTLIFTRCLSLPTSCLSSPLLPAADSYICYATRLVLLLFLHLLFSPFFYPRLRSGEQMSRFSSALVLFSRDPAHLSDNTRVSLVATPGVPIRTHDLTTLSMASCRMSNNDTCCVSITDVSQN